MGDCVIRIDDGDTFEGTLEQFATCFFSHPTVETIADWCRGHNMKLEVFSGISKG